MYIYLHLSPHKKGYTLEQGLTTDPRTWSHRHACTCSAAYNAKGKYWGQYYLGYTNKTI